MAKFWQQTEREKRGIMAGIGLFFGALLGANLGTLSAVPLEDYIYLVILLAGAVSAIQISVISERRSYVFATLGTYVAILAAMIFLPELRPEMPEADLLKLMATLGIWLAATVAVELTPSADGEESSISTSENG